MQFKTTMRCHIPRLKINVSKKKNGRTTGWRGRRATRTRMRWWWAYEMVQPLWTRVGQLLMKWVIHLPCDPAIPLLEMNIHVHTEICTWMFLAALFISTKNWKQPKYPSGGKWINKPWYMHSNKTIDTCNNMDESQMHYNTWKKTDSNDYTISFTGHSGKDKTLGMKNRSAVVRGSGMVGQLNSNTKEFRGDRTALCLYRGGYTTLRICQNAWNWAPESISSTLYELKINV